MRAAKKIIGVVLVGLMVFIGAGTAQAVSFTFSDNDFLGGISWGTLEITAVDADSLSVKYTATSSPLIPAGSEATGFAFTFVPNTTLATVSNPTAGAYNWDLDGLAWYVMDENQSYPNPANGDEFIPPITKFDYYFRLGNDPNNAGVQPGQADVFFLQFTGVPDLTDEQNLENFIALTGVRLQSLPENINTGSLFLAGRKYREDNPIPEPSTMLLLGAGLLGLGAWRRRKAAK